MGRFSALLESATSASPAALEAKGEEEEEKEFLVDNSQLKSKSRGLQFRCSPGTEDEASTSKQNKVANFGSFVRGALYNDGWIKVKGCGFLPREVGGVLVLIPASWARQEDVPEKATSSTAWKAREGKPRAPVVQGTGALFEVVPEIVVVRIEPMHDSKARGHLKAGEVVELFEWDSSYIFRRVLFRGGDGWMMIDHPQHGPLLRPKDQPRCATPLVPICVAAAEGNLAHLCGCIADNLDVNMQDADGCTPLMLAAMLEDLDCCVVLLAGGADPTITTCGGYSASRASSATVRALIEGLSGQDYNLDDFDAATELLRPEVRLMAEGLLDKAADEIQARRRREQGLDDEGMLLEEKQRAACMDKDVEDATQVETVVEDATQGGAFRLREGTKYRVVHQAVRIREEPKCTAEMVGTRLKGDIVELHEFDSSVQWRRIWLTPEDAYWNGAVGVNSGWMLLEHEMLGTLLEKV